MIAPYSTPPQHMRCPSPENSLHASSHLSPLSSSFLLASPFQSKTCWSLISEQFIIPSFGLLHPSHYNLTSIFFSSRLLPSRPLIFSLIPLNTIFFILTIDQNILCWCPQCFILSALTLPELARPSSHKSCLDLNFTPWVSMSLLFCMLTKN